MSNPHLPFKTCWGSSVRNGLSIMFLDVSCICQLVCEAMGPRSDGFAKCGPNEVTVFLLMGIFSVLNIPLGSQSLRVSRLKCFSNFTAVGSLFCLESHLGLVLRSERFYLLKIPMLKP